MILEHEPVQSKPYRPPKRERRHKRPSAPRFRGAGLAILLLALLTAGAWYAMEQAQLISFETDPATATVHLESPHMMVNGQALLWRGRHTANVKQKATIPGKSNSRRVEMRHAPCRPLWIPCRANFGFPRPLRPRGKSGSTANTPARSEKYWRISPRVGMSCRSAWKASKCTGKR